jgi:hypothetical protein
MTQRPEASPPNREGGDAAITDGDITMRTYDEMLALILREVGGEILTDTTTTDVQERT